jgi:UDP-N-acetylglucosamine pyrophosphorylase
VAARTDADKKGGHLARAKLTGGLLLREAAQCPDEQQDEFQNVQRYKFFNTNNLWVNLPALKKAFDAAGGLLPLPVIKNSKTVDPRNKRSTKESTGHPRLEDGRENSMRSGSGCHTSRGQRISCGGLDEAGVEG